MRLGYTVDAVPVGLLGLNLKSGTMSKRNSPTQYGGPLTPSEAALGMDAATRNARGLLSDAELLMQNGRRQRATALAILSIEEAGKIEILRELLLARNEKELKDSWRRYRSHTKKNVLWLLPQLVSAGARKLEDLRPLYDGSADHGRLLNSVKQLALYSDALGECHWSVPEEVVDQNLAEQIISTGKLLVGVAGGAFTTEGELEIWVKHMRPVWKGEMGEMKKALLACYAEAEAKGVLRGKATEFEMLKFVYEDPSTQPVSPYDRIP